MKISTWLSSLLCVSLIQGSTLHRDIDIHLKKLKNHQVGIKVVSGCDNTLFYQKNEHYAFIPASATKLATAIAGLHILGPQYQFATSLTTNGTIKNGVLHGNICLQGSGDPSLTTADLRSLVRDLKKLGIKKITGNIIVDASVFDTHYYGPGAAFINTEWRYAPAAILPTCGININHNYFNTTRRAIKNPSHHAGRLLYILLKKSGIYVKKPIRLYQTQYATICATHYSLPLEQLIHNILKDSDNLYSDCVFKAIAAHTATPARWSTASALVSTFLTQEAGLDPHSFVFFDGSGISGKNKCTPHAFIQLLRWSHDHFEYFSELFEALPQAGIDGTMKERIKAGTRGTRIHAKTGKKEGISSLVGYCLHDLKEPLIFAIMIQGPSSAGRKKATEDAIVKTVLKHHT